jgi:hypothetical protein
MGLMILADAEGSIVLLLLLFAALGLTYWEARERDFDRRLTTWWMLLVLLIHVIGYIALRVWLMIRDRRTT